MYNEFERQEDEPVKRVVGKLPRGYLEMGHADFEALDVPTLRAIYAEVREIAAYTMGRDAVDSAVRAKCPVTPMDWILAVMLLECGCVRCRGTGTYSWGACINGRMTHSAPCARCGGKGRMTFDDMRRGRAYDNYAILKACRG